MIVMCYFKYNTSKFKYTMRYIMRNIRNIGALEVSLYYINRGYKYIVLLIVKRDSHRHTFCCEPLLLLHYRITMLVITNTRYYFINFI